MKARSFFSRILGRRANTLAIAAIVGFAGLILGLQRAPGGPNNIVIKDSKGQKRIEIGVFGDAPGLIMYHKNGQPCVRLEMLEEEDGSQGYLRFMAPNDERCTAAFGADFGSGKRDERSSWVQLSGHRGSSLELNAGVMPQIEIQGCEPETKSSLTLNVLSGSPCIIMKDKHGKDRLLSRLAIDGSPHFICKDKTGKTVWQAPSEGKDSASDKPKDEKQEEGKKE